MALRGPPAPSLDKVPTGENTFKNFATRKLLIGSYVDM